MKPLTFGAIVFIAGLAADDLYRFLSWRSITVSVPTPPPRPSEWDKEVQLCDRAVDAFLHTKDALELTRAQMIIQAENCDIGKRL
jgi:hypothetical protein